MEKKVDQNPGHVVQRRFKNCAVSFQGGPKFKDLPIDGYKPSLNPVARVRLIKLKIEDFFVITNGCESVFQSLLS
jgi:hypothetical protein